MELEKLRELVTMLRELGVSRYACDKIQLELQYDEWVEDAEVEEIPANLGAQRDLPDPELARLTASVPAEYLKAFGLSVKKVK